MAQAIGGAADDGRMVGGKTAECVSSPRVRPITRAVCRTCPEFAQMGHEVGRAHPPALTRAVRAKIGARRGVCARTPLRRACGWGWGWGCAGDVNVCGSESACAKWRCLPARKAVRGFGMGRLSDISRPKSAYLPSTRQLPRTSLQPHVSSDQHTLVTSAHPASVRTRTAVCACLYPLRAQI
jgi:hypothetical protein